MFDSGNVILTVCLTVTR